MTRTLLLCTSALSLLFANTAFADPGSSATIEQVAVSAGNAADANGANNNNSAVIDQTQASGIGTEATITQYDQNNTASITQGSTGNTATVTQWQTNSPVNGNAATLRQFGTSGAVTLFQDGNNYTQVLQAAGSSGEVANVGQFGSQPYGSGGIEITQAGHSEQAGVFQNGSDNTSLINQSGTGGGRNSYDVGWFPGDFTVPGSFYTLPMQYAGAVSVQASTAGDISVINQAGYSNFAINSDQQGTGNNLEINQYSGSYQSVALNETGNFDNSTNFGNVGQISQDNGSSKGENELFGTLGSATINQDANNDLAENSQSQSSLGSRASVTQVANSDQSSVSQSSIDDYADVAQSGSGDVSNIMQSGISDTAYVMQSGANDISSITQSGNTFGAAYLNYVNVSQNQNAASSSVAQLGYSNTAYVKQ